MSNDDCDLPELIVNDAWCCPTVTGGDGLTAEQYQMLREQGMIDAAIEILEAIPDDHDLEHAIEHLRSAFNARAWAP